MTTKGTHKVVWVLHRLRECLSLSGMLSVPQGPWNLMWKTYDECLLRQLGQASSMISCRKILPVFSVYSAKMALSYLFICLLICSFVHFLKQGFLVVSLCWNSLYTRLAWNSACLCLQSVGIKGVGQHCIISFLSRESVDLLEKSAKERP